MGKPQGRMALSGKAIPQPRDRKGRGERTWAVSEFQMGGSTLVNVGNERVSKQPSEMSRHGRRVGITTWGRSVQGSNVVNHQNLVDFFCWRQVVSSMALIAFGENFAPV